MNAPPAPHDGPHELTAWMTLASRSTPVISNSWPPRTVAFAPMVTSPSLSGPSKLLYQLTPVITGPSCSAVMTASTDVQCRYPEISPAFCAALAADRPSDPVSLGGY